MCVYKGLRRVRVKLLCYPVEVPQWVVEGLLEEMLTSLGNPVGVVAEQVIREATPEAQAWQQEVSFWDDLVVAASKRLELLGQVGAEYNWQGWITFIFPLAYLVLLRLCLNSIYISFFLYRSSSFFIFSLLFLDIVFVCSRSLLISYFSFLFILLFFLFPLL